ncbi:7249_t:CDS:1, partial [Funneliformis mosseae]
VKPFGIDGPSFTNLDFKDSAYFKANYRIQNSEKDLRRITIRTNHT